MKKPEVTVNFRVLVPLALLFVILTLIFPRAAKFRYDYRKGSPWAYETLIAQFDFPILKTDEQLRDKVSEIHDENKELREENSNLKYEVSDLKEKIAKFNKQDTVQEKQIAALTAKKC